jgi:hypothetical protein
MVAIVAFFFLERLYTYRPPKRVGPKIRTLKRFFVSTKGRPSSLETEVFDGLLPKKRVPRHGEQFYRVLSKMTEKRKTRVIIEPSLFEGMGSSPVFFFRRLKVRRRAPYVQQHIQKDLFVCCFEKPQLEHRRFEWEQAMHPLKSVGKEDSIYPRLRNGIFRENCHRNVRLEIR